MAKRIGIISDTHGLLRPEVISILKTCDCILHAGDVDRPEILDQLRYLGSLYVVRGNNDRDWAEKLSVTLRFKIEGTEFFMTHNKKDVAWDQGTAQVVIFGHSHHYFEKSDRWTAVVESGKLWQESFWRRSHHGPYGNRQWKLECQKNQFFMHKNEHIFALDDLSRFIVH